MDPMHKQFIEIVSGFPWFSPVSRFQETGKPAETSGNLETILTFY
jgi:hypothetical protein